jgi:hypothetical protein
MVKILTVKPNEVFLFDYIADYLQEKCHLADFWNEFDCLSEIKDGTCVPHTQFSFILLHLFKTSAFLLLETVSLSELSLELNQWSITIHSMKETTDRYPQSNLVPFLNVLQSFSLFKDT